ncbi:MAG: hypothetical protein KDA22_03485 [Phycisphaerales bacterium]|nr:hypothetical protein [Phycisphaerales bacterium]
MNGLGRNHDRELGIVVRLSTACVVGASIVLVGCSGAPSAPERVAASATGDASLPPATSTNVAAPDPRAAPPAVRPPGPLAGPPDPGPSSTDRGRAVTAGAVGPGSAIERRPWRYGDAEGLEIVTPRFRFFTTVTDERMLRPLPILMEQAQVQYTSALGPLPAPPGRLETYLFNRRSEWAQHTKDLLGSDAGPYLSIGRGGYTTEAQSVLFNLGREDTFTLAIHEGWHQYTQATFRESLPVWLEEGIACYMEGHRFRRSEEVPTFMPWRNLERFGELRSAVSGDRLIDLDRLLNGSPQSFLGEGRNPMLVYYAQVWALVMFLSEGEDGRYRDALHQVVLDAAEGRLRSRLAESNPGSGGHRRGVGGVRSRDILRTYFNTDLSQLQEQYSRFVQEIAASGNSTAVWRGRSPLTP